MPHPTAAVQSADDSRVAALDKPAGQGSQAAEGDIALPPRVIVELPDGDILIGEDSGRLRHENIEEQPRQQHNSRTGAQPGSEQWLELRRLLYATGLEAIVLTRKRATSIVLGVDLVYMLMAIANIALRGIETTGARLFDIRIVLALNILGALLDCITIAVVVRQRHKAMRILTILHGILLLAIDPRSYIAIAIIRVLLVSFLFRLLAALVELRWVVNGLPLEDTPKPAWIQGVLLGVHLSSLRSEYFSAMQQMARQSAREAAGGGAEVQMHTVYVELSSPADREEPMFEREVQALPPGAPVPTPRVAVAVPTAAADLARGTDLREGAQLRVSEEREVDGRVDADLQQCSRASHREGPNASTSGTVGVAVDAAALEERGVQAGAAGLQERASR